EINVDGSVALLSGVKTEFVRDHLSFNDPDRFYNKAFREKRWDGKKALWSLVAGGYVFPAGLLPRVERALRCAGLEFQTRGSSHSVNLDLKRLTPKYLHGVTLRPEQFAAVKAMLG